MSRPWSLFMALLFAVGCNTAPEALQVTIAPESPTTTDDLAAEVSGAFTDADGDEVSYSFTWYADGVPQDHITGLTVPATETAKHQEWKLFVQPSDGKLDGPPSEAVVVVLNSLPVVEVTLSPSVPLTTEDVAATVEVSDADGDEIDLVFTWLLDGAESGYQDSTLPASATERGDVWTVRVTPNDDESAGTPVQQAVSIENTAPVVTSVSLTPLEPREGGEITAGVITDDEDGDDVSLYYRWYVDEALALEGEHPALGDGFFAKHQNVHVEVTPNDGFIDGIPLESDAVTVQNTAPAISGASVSPQEVYEASELSCVGAGWDDADGDAEAYQTTWYVNGAEATGVTCDDGEPDCLDGAAFDKDQNVSCSLVPDDGEDRGDVALSDTVTVLNTAPIISDARLSTTSPAEGDAISVAITDTDDDGDTISYGYSWFVNGVQVSTAASIDSNLFDKHQSIYVEVTPRDGREDGSAVTSDTASAVNTPPEIVTLGLDPSELYTADEVSAAVSTVDADGDDVILSYAWTVDGTDPGVTGSSLPGAAYFDKHQTVALTVTPNDGEDDGLYATTSVAVLNSPPTAPELATAPTYPEALVDDIVCSIETGSTDADGDSVSYSFAWDVDGMAYLAGDGADTGDTGGGWLGALTTTETGDTVPGEDTRDNQTWTCAVTPNDGTEDGVVAEATTVSRFLIEPQVDCGRAHTCLLDQGGQLTCWGSDSDGQSTPPAGEYSHIAVTDDGWSCAIDNEGAIQCWGDQTAGRDTIPAGTFVQLSGGNGYMLALGDTGQVQCWGADDSYGCNHETSTIMVQVEAGENGACGVDTSGSVECWGHTRGGVDAVPSGTFTKVEYAWMHACALDTSGTVHCWGDDTDGMATPPSGTFCDIGVGEAHSCAMDCSGSIQCWGHPGIITPPTGSFIQMDVGDYYACAVDSAGLVQCWGDDGYGQSTVPPDIAGP